MRIVRHGSPADLHKLSARPFQAIQYPVEAENQAALRFLARCTSSPSAKWPLLPIFFLAPLLATLALTSQAAAQDIGEEAGILLTEPTPRPTSPPPPAHASPSPVGQGTVSRPADLSPSPLPTDDATTSATEAAPAVVAPAIEPSPTTTAEEAPAATPVQKPKIQTIFIDMIPTVPSDAKVFDESGLAGSKTAKDRHYTVPLLFAPEDNGFELGRPQIRWDLASGTDVLLTGLRVKADAIGFVITQSPRQEKGSLFSFFERHDDRPLVTNVSFRWPQIFATTGDFSIEQDDGTILWKKTITSDDRNQWRSYLNSKAAAHSQDTRIHSASAWGMNDIDPKQFAIFFKRVTVRACLTKLADQDQKLRICTGQFYLTPHKDGHVSYTDAARVPATATLDGKDIGLRGLLNFPENKKINFGIRFASGAEINVTSQPLHLRIYDVVESPTGRTALLTGEGAQPVGHVKMLKNPEIHFWSGTIIKQDRIWQLAIPKEAPVVKVLGAFNMPFDLLFEAKRLPKEADRVYIADRQTQTYSRLPTLYGTANRDLTVSSSQFGAKKIGPETFEWEFLADHSSDDNRARIKLTEKDGTPWVAHYDMFRAYPNEFSARFTGVVSSGGQAVAMGEVSAFHWFEDLGFTDNKTFALQHWGVNLRYFKALSSFDLGEGQIVSDYEELSGNLRYNLNRGIWNRDEIFGIMASGEHLTFSTLSANLVGPGVYWGRTMPKLADDLFNIIPFLRYPKYLDVEFSYLPFALSAKTTAGATYNLTFRGKVFFRQSLFGEAGFGIKQLQFTDLSQGQQAAFATAFGLIGLGLLF